MRVMFTNLAILIGGPALHEPDNGSNKRKIFGPINDSTTESSLGSSVWYNLDLRDISPWDLSHPRLFGKNMEVEMQQTNGTDAKGQIMDHSPSPQLRAPVKSPRAVENRGLRRGLLHQFLTSHFSGNPS